MVEYCENYKTLNEDDNSEISNHHLSNNFAAVVAIVAIKKKNQQELEVEEEEEQEQPKTIDRDFKIHFPQLSYSQTLVSNYQSYSQIAIDIDASLFMQYIAAKCWEDTQACTVNI